VKLYVRTSICTYVQSRSENCPVSIRRPSDFVVYTPRILARSELLEDEFRLSSDRAWSKVGASTTQNAAELKQKRDSLSEDVLTGDRVES